MSGGEERIWEFVFSCEIVWNEEFPDNLLISFHIVERDWGLLIPETCRIFNYQLVFYFKHSLSLLCILKKKSSMHTLKRNLLVYIVIPTSWILQYYCSYLIYYIDMYARLSLCRTKWLLHIFLLETIECHYPNLRYLFWETKRENISREKTGCKLRYCICYTRSTPYRYEFSFIVKEAGLNNPKF